MRQILCYLALYLLAFLVGCEKQGDQREQMSAKKAEMLIFVGAGLRPVADELADLFAEERGVQVTRDYAGSEVLLNKIKLSQRGDVYMPGDKHYVDLAANDGMIRSQASVCYFVPTIFVQKGNPKEITGLKDLLKPGVRLGLGDDRACAIGRTARRIFEINDIAWSDVEKNLEYQSLTVNELGIQIRTGSLDAVIVWDAVAAIYAKDGDQIPIPLGQNVISTVDAGVLSFSEQPKLAEQFIEFARSDCAREIFRRHGYRIELPQ